MHIPSIDNTLPTRREMSICATIWAELQQSNKSCEFGVSLARSFRKKESHYRPIES
jgi:hypothetical protein